MHISNIFRIDIQIFPNKIQIKNVPNPKLSFKADDDDKSYHPESSENESIDEEDNTEDDIMKLATAVPTAGTNGVDSQLNSKCDLEVEMQLLVIVMP